MKRFRRVAAACVVVTMLLAGVSRAQVLDQVPSSALVVLKVNNLKGTSDKVAKLAADLGIAAMAPPLADPLGSLQGMLNMQQGVDVNGELAFVYCDPDAFGGDPDKSMLILVPVSDYQAFVANWPAAKTEGAISEVQLGTNGAEPGFVAQWGKYAAISPLKETLGENKPAALGIKSPTVTAKELSSKDAVLYANMETLRAKLIPELKANREPWLAELERSLANEPQAARFSPVVKMVVTQALNAAETFLNDSQAATIGISLADEGINFTVMSEFSPGSYLGNTITSIKNTNEPLVTGLPDGKYLVFGGSHADPAVSGKVLNDLIEPVIKELTAMGPEMNAATEWYAAFKEYVAANQGQAFGVVAPTGALGAEPLMQFISVQKGDPKVLGASYAKMMQTQQDLMKALNIPGSMAMTPTHTPNAKTLDGVTFDSVVNKIDMNAQDPQAMQQAQAMNMMYGPDGMVIHYGAVNDQLLVVSGVPDAVVSGTIAAVKAKEAPLAKLERVAVVAKQLPAERFAAAYIPVDDIAMTILGYARQFGFPMNIQLPPDLPPVGVTGATEGTAMRFDAHIPTTLIQSLVAAGMQAAMQMQGGGMPQGGGL